MSELKNCPFLMRLCSMDGQIIGYTCKGECANCPAEDAKDKEIERLKRELKLADSAAELTCLKLESEVKKLKADNQVYRDMLNSLLNEEVYHLDNATMTNIKYELDNRGKDTNVPANAPDTNVGTMEG